MTSRALDLLTRFSPGLPDPLPPEPMVLLECWLNEAVSVRGLPNPNAMVLATSSAEADPSSRVVLCRGLDAALGTVTLFTNLESRKASDLKANPRAEAVFFWDSVSRQARVHGPVVAVGEAEAAEYFAGRPLMSRLGAWASAQSQRLASRVELAERLLAVMDRFGVTEPDLSNPRCAVVIPKPPDWGGFRVWADRVELWTMGDGRLHDRAEWRRVLRAEGGGFAAGAWSCTRLCP